MAAVAIPLNKRDIIGAFPEHGIRWLM